MDLSNLSLSGFTPEEIEKISAMDDGTFSVESREKKLSLKERLMGGASSNPEQLTFDNPYQSMEVVDELRKQVSECEIMLQAMWGLLKDKGATSEELNEKMEFVMKVRDSSNTQTHIICDNCGKQMQDIKKEIFKYRCLYCGSEKVINPYDKFEILEKAENSDENSENEDILNKEFVPYDVSKDLGFDEEENQ